MIRLIICEPFKLVYRPLPKCASTTLLALLRELGGTGTLTSRRPTFPTLSADNAPGHGGTYSVRCDDQALADLTRRCADYAWFAVVRNPYDRVVSNYHNKVNRFARRFNPGIYLRACVGQILRGPAAWKDTDDKLRRIQARISFERFVCGLSQHGIDWDAHFRLQSEMLQLSRVRYDHLIRMEHLAAGLREVLARGEGAAAGEAVIARMGWLNRSAATTAADPWTPATRAIVADVYERDFEALGYAA